VCNYIYSFWRIAMNTIELYNTMNLCYGIVSEFCSETTCPQVGAYAFMHHTLFIYNTQFYIFLTVFHRWLLDLSKLLVFSAVWQFFKNFLRWFSRVTYFWADNKKKEKPVSLPAPEVCMCTHCWFINYCAVHRKVSYLDIGTIRW
jgi:hypothetical protein